MKVLLDTCVWGKAREELTAAGHDVIWAGDWPEDPGDEEILDRAFAEGRILVTLDKDFGELAIVHDKRHCGIVRLVGISARQQATLCVHVLAKYGDGCPRHGGPPQSPGPQRREAIVRFGRCEANRSHAPQAQLPAMRPLPIANEKGELPFGLSVKGNNATAHA